MKYSQMSPVQVTIGSLHVLMMLFNSFYGFVFKKSWFDYVYLCAYYLVILHWTFLNGECLITYVYKKMKNKNYMAGDNLNENEIKPLLNLSNRNYSNVVKIHLILAAISIYIVSSRNKIPLVLFISLLALTLSHGIALAYFKKNYRTIKEYIKYALIALGIVSLWLFNKRFKFI